MFVLTRRHLLSLASASAASAFAPATWASRRPITAERFVPIGGIEQWIAIRGRDRARTAVLFLHGGFGEAQSPFLSFYAPWEKRYVVAQWDQRGSGKTFGKMSASTPDLTLEQLTRDAVEVTQYVLEQLGVRKLVLIGHSCGSLLGLCVVRSRPELFHAFVGTGQIISGTESIESWRVSALARARAAQDADAVAQLSDSRPGDNSNPARLELITKWMAQFEGSDHDYVFRQQAAFVGTYPKRRMQMPPTGTRDSSSSANPNSGPLCATSMPERPATIFRSPSSSFRGETTTERRRRRHAHLWIRCMRR